MDKCNKKSYYIVTEVTHNIFNICSDIRNKPPFLLCYIQLVEMYYSIVHLRTYL